MFVLKFIFFLGDFMNQNNGSRNWLLWLAIILVVIAVVYFVKNRMNKPEVMVREVPVMEEDMSPETQVDAVQEVEQQKPEQVEPAAQA
jgi:hypothetical protein